MHMHRSAELESEASFAEGVLGTVSRHFGSVSPSSQERIVGRLRMVQCVPTTRGMQLPEAAYFASVSFFPDLPHVQVSDKHAVSRTLLQALGVRQRVALALVFERLADLQWDAPALVRYLASVQGQLTDQERDQLVCTPFLAADSIPPDPKVWGDECARAGCAQATNTLLFGIGRSGVRANCACRQVWRMVGFPSSLANRSLVTAHTDTMRQLRMPVVHWPGVWRPNTPEGTH